MRITQLTCNAMTNPIGFELQQLRLGWMLEAEGFNRSQSAYQIEISVDGTVVLDTGKVCSTRSTEMTPELETVPRTRYDWRVRVWDENGEPTDWSDTAFFETARGDAPWTAEWIGAKADLPAMRRDVYITKPIRRARAYACGVGLYVLFVNGQRVSDEYLNPNFNAYDLWLQYQTFDVTGLLHEGENRIGAWLGKGYYAGRVGWPGIEARRKIYGECCALIAEIDVEYMDGTHEIILTDESWQTAQGPYDLAEIYDGEVFDARRLDLSFSRGNWEQAEILPLNKNILQARRSLPVRVMETRPVEQVLRSPEGTVILDFGQNLAGWLRMRVHEPAGTKLTLRFGEVLTKEGSLYTENLRTARAQLDYISSGEPGEYAPSFTFFGFRYAEVTGIETVNPDDFVAEVIYSAMPMTGTFTCSDERVNRLFLNTQWGQRGNFVDTPTDCPQRDERMGWTGDAQVFCPTACLHMPCGAFYRKYLYDLAQEQQKMGFVPVVVPNILLGSGQWTKPTTAWADASTIMPWALYTYFGDRDALEMQYDSMRKHVDFITACGDVHDGVYGGDAHLGDWLAQDTKDPDNHYGLTPTELVATAYYARSAELVAKAAQVLGKTEDAQKYAALAQKEREAFRREFVSPSGRVVSETQTAAALALYFDMLTPEQAQKAAAQLKHRLHVDKLHLTTGFVGTPCLCPSLSENGLNEYAYALLLSEGCPGWLYEVDMGATTMWERWNSMRPDGSFGPVSMNSFNHYAFGSIAEWMYRYVCGINPDESAPGFRHAIVKPMPNSMLQHAKASTLTPYGTLESGWAIDGDVLRVTVTIPCNTTATIILPDAEDAEITENGAPIGKCTVMERGSGRWEYAYRFSGESIHKRPEA